MHTALLILTRLRWAADFRRTYRQARTLRGALLLLVWIGFVLPAITCGLLGTWFQPEAVMATTGAFVRDFAVFGMFAVWFMTLALSSGDQALAFSMAEVDWLFAAPFTRRDLIAHKLSLNALGLVLMGLMFSIMGRIGFHLWIAGFAGIVLLLAFFQLSLIAVALTRQMVAERAYTRTRRLLMGGVLVAVALGVGQAIAGRDLADWRGLAVDFRASWTGRCLLAPFEVYGRTITAERLFPDAVGWGLLGLAIDAALVAGVMFLDANYLEAAAEVSRKRYEATQRVMRGDWWSARKTHAKLRLPPPAWLAGAGPVAWRQTLHLLRGSINLLDPALVAAGICVAVPLFHDTPNTRFVVSVIADYLAGMSLFFASFLPFGLRADVDRLDTFKSLPLATWAVVLGQLGPPAALLSLIQIVLLGAAALVHSQHAVALLAVVFFAPPVCLLLVACDNLLFLLFPYRTAPAVAGDMQSAGRQMLLMTLRLPVLMFLGGVAGGGGVLAFFVARESWLAFAAAAWCVLACEVVSMLAACTWAFQRFHVSIETPAE
ncbi:MAG TPA: putative ABC exporter domain-containing protein [Pirellulales bacterium]|nr:putative ABC exporter domain-containing protein [Pirellulales bacterium]